MSDEAGVRRPVQAAERAPTPEASNTSSPSQGPTDLFATYQSVTGTPYTAQHYELGSMWDKNSTLKQETEAIESHVRRQVESGKLSNSTKAADKYLKTLEKEAKINSEEDSAFKLTKLVAYIEFLNKVGDAEREMAHWRTT